MRERCVKSIGWLCEARPLWLLRHKWELCCKHPQEGSLRGKVSDVSIDELGECNTKSTNRRKGSPNYDWMIVIIKYVIVFLYVYFWKISRESHHMRGLNVLQMCLAMNMYGHLPSEVIQSVFNLSFMDQLDEEIDKCYSKVWLYLLSFYFHQTSF